LEYDPATLFRGKQYYKTVALLGNRASVCNEGANGAQLNVSVQKARY